ncbi:MAG: hypothetical protein ACD_45C00698G0004 [uncultured bacterium]|nr:MAG: hypothetical protein ACD_45C00698G0004 [uncultured bacterium]
MISETQQNHFTSMLGSEQILKQSRLTPREKQYLSMIIRGDTAKEIASQLGISFRTVEWAIAALKRKLGVRNKAQLILAI